MIIDRLLRGFLSGLKDLEQGVPEPVHLKEVTERIRDENSKPSKPSLSLLVSTIEYLQRHGAGSLDSGDDLILSSGFTMKVATLSDQALFQMPPLRNALLERWSSKLEDPLLGLLLWRAVFLAYFETESSDLARTFRQFLMAGLPAMQKNEFPPAWLQYCLQHRELFGNSPGQVLAKQWFAGRVEAVDSLREYVPVPESSWLWEEMVKEILESVGKLSETAFGTQMGRLLDLMEAYPGHADRVLAALLEGYAGFRSLRVPPNLIELVIDRWGNPQMELVDRAHRWSLVSDSTRIWMCQLLAEQDLADFFDLITKTSKSGLNEMDTRRLEFWKKYTGHMSYTRLVLGDDFFNSSNGSVRTFVANRRKRLGRLVNDAANAAFLMRIGDYWCIEFSKTGNAFYAYLAGSEPFVPYAESIATALMKSRLLAAAWVSHNGNWEPKLSDYMQKIMAGNFRPVPKKYREVKRDDFTRIVASLAKWDVNEEKVRGRLSDLARNELDRISPVYVDNRYKAGGAFWVRTSLQPNQRLREEMRAIGFRYALHKGFYL